jgi:3-hydroxyacyl-CoA dehydrogenase/enoyl-CoA hydratase/3-hydroxybutyryl-CoA epimerase
MAVSFTSDCMQLELRPDGVAVVIFTATNAPANVLSRVFFSDFGRLLDLIESSPEIKGVVLSSGRPKEFVVGADLREIRAAGTAAEEETFVRNGHQLLDRVARGPKRFIAAIDGAALGGGLEVALACQGRVATNERWTVFGVPEVQLGLIPSGGATQRLPRAVPLPLALEMLLTGERIRAPEALRRGLIDRVVGRERLIPVAAEMALAPDGRPRSLRSSLLRMWPLRTMVISGARKETMERTRGLYPAPLRILDCVSTGLSRGTCEGLKAEARAFGELATGRTARNLIWLFYASTELRKAPPPESLHKLDRIAILGGGLMGEGIASVSLGLADVVVRDVAEEAVIRSGARIRQSLARRVDTGSLTEEEATLRERRLRVTTDFSRIADSDLLIEAIPEDLQLKQEVLRECEQVLAPEAIYASNTSAIPIAQIAAGARHPERVVGMHYFSPVAKMQLVEVIAPRAAAPQAVAFARAVAVRQGKSVIVVEDGPGFYTTRILAPLLNEAILLLEEGGEVADIDSTMRDFGFPLGPLALLDEVGIDIGAHVSRELAQAFRSREPKPSTLPAKLLDQGIRGRKSGRGFYLYGRKWGGKTVNREVYRLAGGSQRHRLPAGEILDRLSLIMVNEAAHCLGEGIVHSPSDGDVGAILGLGFPPFRGGPFHFIDGTGASLIADRLAALAERLGKRFEPAPLLRQMAGSEGKFYK